jgi:hypothetical protein
MVVQLLLAFGFFVVIISFPAGVALWTVSTSLNPEQVNQYL